MEVEERARDAEDLLDSKLFQTAMQTIYSRAAGTLVKADVGSLTAGAAHATMKAIVDIRSQLQQYVDDHKMRQKYNKGDK